MTLIFVFAVVTHPELRRLCRRRDPGDRAGGAVRHPDPDHDRRAALGHRHRRHGPAGALQRAGHVRPRGRGGGRRRHAAARQDRHDHARQPPGDRVHRRARRHRARSWPTRRSSPRWPTRRPRAARSSCWPRRSTACAAREMAPLHAQLRAVHRPDPDERRRRRRRVDPQGRGRRGASTWVDGRAEGGARAPRASCERGAPSASRKARRHAAGGGRATAGCSASSTSRTSSRAASASASPSCAGWASAR